MTIREVIELLKSIFESLIAIVGPLFSGNDEEAEDGAEA